MKTSTREKINDRAQTHGWTKEIVNVAVVLCSQLPEPKHISGNEDGVTLCWYRARPRNWSQRSVSFMIEPDLDPTTPPHMEDPDNGVLISLCEGEIDGHAPESHYFTVLDHDIDRLRSIIELWLADTPIESIDMT